MAAVLIRIDPKPTETQELISMVDWVTKKSTTSMEIPRPMV